MVQSIDRAMLIIHLLSSDERRDWAISDLAEQADLPVSTMHRLLQSLMRHELVSQNPDTKQYRMGHKWMELGLRTLNTIDFRMVARPILESLAQEAEENVYINIVSGSGGIIIEKIESPLKIRVAEDLGFRIPLSIGAPNKVLLAYMSPKEQQEVLQQVLPAQKDTLLLQLQEIREQGYAISMSECTENTASVAAPIWDFTNKVIASVSVGVPGFRFTEERVPQLIEKVKKAAEAISSQLGRA
jgi:DNA-binding IclR family transcriptional regulator